MPTLEEALAAATVDSEPINPVNDILLINPETRMISVPETEKLFGARQDMDAERKYFRCPRIVGDNIDLSQHHIYVSYVPSKQDGTYSATEEVGSYLCEDLAVDGEYVTFSWRLSGNVFQKAGYIAFAVYAKQVDTDGNLKTKWHTAIAIGNVLDTLPDGSQVLEKYPDVIEQIVKRMDSLTQVSPEDIANAVSEYMTENPVAIPEKLPNPQKLTFTGAVTAEYDGSGAVTVTIPDGTTERIEKGSTDTTATIQLNKLYVFPEMAELSLTFAEPTDTSIANEYHVIFRSGATATILTIPDTVKVPDGFTVESNKVYELSVLENCLSYMSM